MFARTDRLLLRPGFAEDAPELASAIGEQAIADNLAQVPWPYGVSEARSFLAIDHPPLLPSFLILMRTDGQPKIVGGIGLHAAADNDQYWGKQASTEIGYWVARPYWGLGIATEAGRAVIAIVRSVRMPPLVAGHFVDNPASGSVLRKLGFRATGRIVQRHSMARGRTAPCALYQQADGDDAAGVADLPTMADTIYSDHSMTSRLAA